MIKERATIYFIRLDSDLPHPDYQCEGDAGFDLHVMESGEVCPDSQTRVSTGLVLHKFQKGDYEPVLEIRPRSGLSSRGILIAEDVKTEDDIAEEIFITVMNTTKEPFIFKKGDRLAQGVLTSASKIEIEQVY